jgi:hypothetical protein
MTACMTDPVGASIAQISTRNEQVRDQLRAQSEAFWTIQDRILGQMERTSRAWFERRHEGTQAALKAAASLCQCATPADAVQEYVSWASGSVERMTRDAMDAQAYVAAMAELFLGATHKVMHGPSEAGDADIMTPGESEQPVPFKTAA